MSRTECCFAALVADNWGNWGYLVYIVGGTLLGAMRSGNLLLHDGDIDFGQVRSRSLMDTRQL